MLSQDFSDSIKGLIKEKRRENFKNKQFSEDKTNQFSETDLALANEQ